MVALWQDFTFCMHLAHKEWGLLCYFIKTASAQCLHNGSSLMSSHRHVNYLNNLGVYSYIV